MVKPDQTTPTKVSRVGGLPYRYAALLVAVVLFCQSGFGGSSGQFIATLIALNVIGGLGLTVMFGWAGLLSVAQAGLMAVGAYTFAIGYAHGLGDWPSAILGVVAAVAVGAFLGLLGSRIRSHYFILATLAVAEIVQIVINNQVNLTGGDNGLSKMPPLGVAGHAVHGAQGLLTLVAVVTVAVMYVCSSLRASRSGLGMRTLNANEVLGLSVGVSPPLTRLMACSVAGALAGVAGVLYAGSVGYLGPSDFGVNEALVLLVGVVIGGMDSVVGSAIGLCVASYLAFGEPSLNTVGPLIYGGAVVIVLLVAPGGIAGSARTLLLGRRLARLRRSEVGLARSGAEMVEGVNLRGRQNVHGRSGEGPPRTIG